MIDDSATPDGYQRRIEYKVWRATREEEWYGEGKE